MNRPSHECGATRATVLLVTLASATLGGVAWFMTGNSALSLAKGQTVAAQTKFMVPEPPRVADEPKKPEVTNKELEKVMQGEMVQYRDKVGNVLYRKTELIEGKTGTGKPTFWQMTVRPSPISFDKFKSSKGGDGKDKTVKKKVKGSDAPKLQFSNGKLTTVPNTPTNGGAGGGSNGGGSDSGGK